MEYIIQLRAGRGYDWYEAAYFLIGHQYARVFNSKLRAEKVRECLIQAKRTSLRNSRVIECPSEYTTV